MNMNTGISLNGVELQLGDVLQPQDSQPYVVMYDRETNEYVAENQVDYHIYHPLQPFLDQHQQTIEIIGNITKRKHRKTF